MARQNQEHLLVNELNHELAHHQCQEIDDAINCAMPNFNMDDIPEEVQGNVLFDALSRRGQLYIATGFTEDKKIN